MVNRSPAFSLRVMSTPTEPNPSAQLAPVVRKYWGYESLRPLQTEAMSAVVEHRDSIVVLPTGGGKSLCYQAPVMTMKGLAVVVTPLLSLMKDQTDALQQCGVPAACLNSMQSTQERSDVMRQLRQGTLKLLYVAPERLAAAGFFDMLRGLDVAYFAIDEAHCISSWGHEFRPDYRRLSSLRETFPKIGIHAFTATATRKVREDIAQHLALRTPSVHVGLFDRPNLTYRVERKARKWEQMCAVIERHKGDSGIIYCISRKNVEDVAGSLREAGYRALPYHAGLKDEERKQNQDAFLREDVDIIVATVAFGMGIDKSNVRYVLHAAAPKSVENYQQEAGRAGRDGLPAECVLMWGPGDFGTWRRIFSNLPAEAAPAAMRKLSQMSDFCQSSICRHRALVAYFGQSLESRNCRACDICLGDAEPVGDGHVIAQKILSCVVRLGPGHNSSYVGRVLCGTDDERIEQAGHHSLSTYGILSDHDRRTVRDWMSQLQDGGYLESTGTETEESLNVTALGWNVLRDQAMAVLVNPRRAAGRLVLKTAVAKPGLEANLFDDLRTLRRSLADERGVPAFVVFSDSSLLDMARKRPGSLETFMQISGVGEKKRDAFGPAFVGCITEWCKLNNVPTDVSSTEDDSSGSIPLEPVMNATELEAYKQFERRAQVDDVCANLKRAKTTVVRYLENYIRRNQIYSPEPWLSAEQFARIMSSVDRVGGDRLRPIFDDLDGYCDYDDIRIALACRHPAQASHNER